VAHREGRHGDFKIILKESLKFLPIFGWGMYFYEFIFVGS
jgi:1-acyl-sn-glycerol-3-phosphate acyltransferase